MTSFLNHRCFIDLHVHTNRYSQCAEGLNPELIPSYMKDKNLHGVILTEHDVMWSSADIDMLNRGLKNRRIYNGIEVSSVDGHFLIIGMDQSDEFHQGISIERIIRLAHKNNAAIILAHHHRSGGNGMPVDVLALPDGIHAIEVASTITYGKNEYKARQYANMKKWHSVAGSDAHHMNNIGAAFTAFKKLPADSKELAHDIRSGLGIPMRSENSIVI